MTGNNKKFALILIFALLLAFGPNQNAHSKTPKSTIKSVKATIGNKARNLKNRCFKKTPEQNPLVREPLSQRQQKYIEITPLLSEETLTSFDEIRLKEFDALRPLSLDLEAKLLRQDELYSAKCKWYQRTCKKEKKADLAFLQNDIKELKRQIWQKKEYYKILYINETTREEDLEIRNIINIKTNSKPQLW